jgi:hypothetical protein
VEDLCACAGPAPPPADAFEEAAHNVARHARASRVRVRLELRPGPLRLRPGGVK